MLRKIIFGLLIVLSTSVWSAEEKIQLDRAEFNQLDMASVKRGAAFFSKNCMVCHSLKYMRYNKLAQDAGIKYEKMPLNIVKWPNDVKPPDLSLVTEERGKHWVYTYLHSFYIDEKRPTGFNNLILPNSNMPNVLAPYQGRQYLVEVSTKTTGIFGAAPEWYDILRLQKQGSMTPQVFDATVLDVVNFLSYSAEPYYEKQRKIGFWVILFLCVLFILTYFLKKDYWQDVKKHPK